MNMKAGYTSVWAPPCPLALVNNSFESGLIVGGVVMLLSSGFLMVYDAHLTFFHGDPLSLVILIVLLQNNKRISTCIYKVNCKRL